MIDTTPAVWNWVRAVAHALFGGGYGLMLGACNIHYTTWQFWVLMGAAAFWATVMHQGRRLG